MAKKRAKKTSKRSTRTPARATRHFALAPQPTHTHKPHHKISQGLAIGALLLNVLVLPGIGSLIAGRITEGILQLLLAVIGIPLSFIVIGIPLVLAAWIWGLVTGIQLIQQSE